MSRERWIELGKLGRSHGLKGEVRFHPYNPRCATLRPGLLVRIEGEGVPIECRVLRVERNGDKYNILLDAASDRTSAKRLTNHVLLARRSDFAEEEPGEFYHADLPGLSVEDPAGEVVGRVTEVLQMPAHDVLSIVLEDGGEFLVPVVEAWISGISVEEGVVRLARKLEEPV